MNPLMVVWVTVLAVAVTIGLLWLVRRRLSGAVLANGSGANALYSMMGTAFAVLLAFVVLVSYQSFNSGRNGAEAEAVAVVDMFRDARFFPARDRLILQARVVCYGRSAVQEWSAMKHGRRSATVDRRVADLRQAIGRLRPRTQTGEAAVGDLFGQEDERTAGRRERLSQASPVVTTPVWFALLVGGAVVILCGLVFADRRERFVIQAALVAGVAIVVTNGLLLVRFLDKPYEAQPGSIQPTEMRRSLEIMGEEAPGLRPPCSPSGVRA